MSDEAMDVYNAEVAGNSTLYSKYVDAGDKISMSVSNVKKSLMNVGNRISLLDTETVKGTVFRYVESCERTGRLPTKVGLARACGCTSRGFEQFLKRNPEHPTSIFLGIAVDAFAEAIEESALNGSAQPIVAIFALKAHYGIRENEPIAQTPDNPLGQATDTETLMKKYEELTVD